MAQRAVYLTPEGRKSLDQELAHLTKVRRREVAQRIHKANETGGTVDNAEYDEAKNEQAFVEGRIANLEVILYNAVVTPAGARGRDAVEFGSSVTVSGGGAKRKYTVVGSAETSPHEGKISLESPVGQALIGHKVGDKVEVQTPAGVVSLTITKIA